MATLSNSGLVKLAAGKVVSDAGNLTGANYDQFIEEAEAQLFTETGVDWVSIFSGLDSGKKEVLQSAATAWAAVNAIRFDIRLYPTINHSITQINLNLDRFDRAIARIKDTNVSKIVGGSQESS